MPIRKITFVFLFGVTLVAPGRDSQAIGGRAPDRNFSVRRDAQAISLLSAALAAINPSAVPPVQDLSVSYAIVRWSGNSANGSLAAKAVGSFRSCLRMDVAGQPITTLETEGMHQRRHRQNEPATESTDIRGLEQIPFLPEQLVQYVLGNKSSDVYVQSRTREITVLRVTIRPSYWTEAMEDAEKVSYDLHISTQTNLVETIVVFRHLFPSQPAVYGYSRSYRDYKSISNRIVPSVLVDSVGAAQQDELHLVDLAVNQGLTHSEVHCE